VLPADLLSKGQPDRDVCLKQGCEHPLNLEGRRLVKVPESEKGIVRRVVFALGEPLEVRHS
jgi:hypothetical protein